VADPIILRLSRPYQSIDEFLEAEADWITHKTMLLLDTEELPADTVIRFGVKLANGESPIKAEARVIGYQCAESGRPAGLLVRFKRYGAATKTVVDRAAAIRKDRAAAGLPASTADAPPSQQPDQLDASSPASGTVGIAHPGSDLDAPSHAPSGVHPRVVRPVGTPANREELLARLRQRTAQQRSDDSDALVSAAAQQSTRRATA
jgi:hypothetical protein